MRIIFLTGFVFMCSVALSQQADPVQKGNEYYKQQQFENAVAEYNKALEKDPANTVAQFNLANSLQKQKKQEEAIKIFNDLAKSTNEGGLRSKAYYNKGVAMSQQKRLEESIEAYKNALRNNPDDKDARENLQKALLELKKKNPPKKEDDKQKKKKNDQEKKQQQPQMNPKEAEQRLKLLEQKEKEVQQRLQKDKNKGSGSQAKDW
jgi:Ca-activated chloride channel family protein